MARGKVIDISRAEFSILHELLMEKCYGEKASEAANWSDVELYGHNATIAFPREKSIRKIMDLKVTPRALREAVQSYHYGTLVTISQRLVIECLAFLRFSSLQEMVKAYLHRNNIEDYPAPERLKYSSGVRVSSTREIENDKLRNLANTQWWCYSHTHAAVRKYEDNRVLKILLNIKKRFPNGDYEITWENKDPYTSFSGRIIRKFSQGNVLTCELSSVGKIIEKRFYLFIHTDPDASKDLYLGCFLRHTDGGKIYAGSLVMEKVKSKGPITGYDQEILDFKKNPNESLQNIIMDFLYERRLNRLKIPSYIYSEEDFLRWIEGKPEMTGSRMPKYDLYVTAPYKGFGHRSKQFSNIKKDLLDELKIDEIKDKVERRAKEAAIEKVLERHMPGHASNNKLVDFETANEMINKMIERLKGDEIGFKNIWYAHGKDNYSITGKIDSSRALLGQLSKFSQSKRLLFLLPYPMISSVYIEAGWAMFSERNIPVFIIANRSDLPFLLQKADTLKNRHIYLASWEEVGGIEHIPNWILDNELHKIA